MQVRYIIKNVTEADRRERIMISLKEGEEALLATRQ